MPGDEESKPLVLEAAPYLPSLKGTVWSEDFVTAGTKAFDSALQLMFKRLKFDLRILLADSEDARFDLFQRLNTLGSNLTPQEMRTSILVSLNPELYRWVESLAKYPAFVNSTDLSDEQLSRAFDFELVVRFLSFRQRPLEEIRAINELSEFLDDEVRQIARNPNFDRDEEGLAFRTTFDYLSRAMGPEAFRRWDSNRERYSGGFSASSFEVLALGVGHHYKAYGADTPAETAINVSKEVWGDPTFRSSGIRASTRIPRNIELGRSKLAR